MKSFRLFSSMIAIAATASSAVGQVPASSICEAAGLSRGETYQIDKIFGEPLNAPVNRPYLAGDGSAIVFVSAATNIVATTPTGQSVTPNGFTQVYVTELSTLLTVMISVDANGQPSDADCTLNEGAINYDGSIAIMECTGSNLAGTPDANAASDVFVAFLEDRYGYSKGDLVLASKATTGGVSNGSSTVASIAAKGSVVVFSSNGNNLVDDVVIGEGTAATQNYIFDLNTGAVTLLSRDNSGQPANGFVATPALDAAGKLVVTPSAASNLEEDIYWNEERVGFHFNLFSFNLDGPGLAQVTGTPKGTPQIRPTDFCGRPRYSFAGGTICGSQSPDLSYDGRYLVFDTTTPNFDDPTTSDFNNTTDVYWKDLLTGQYRLVSRAPNKNRAVANPVQRTTLEPSLSNISLSDAAELSGDGRYVIFRSSARELTSGQGAFGYFMVDTLNFSAIPWRVDVPPAGEVPASQKPGNAAALAQGDMPNLTEFGNIAAFESAFAPSGASTDAVPLTGFLRCMI